MLELLIIIKMQISPMNIQVMNLIDHKKSIYFLYNIYEFKERNNMNNLYINFRCSHSLFSYYF